MRRAGDRIPRQSTPTGRATEETDVSLLEIRGLKTYFHTESGILRAVDGIDMNINPEEILGVVGESGCGKTQTAMSIMGLVSSPPGRIEAGEILFNRKGTVVNLAKLDPKGKTIRSIRGNEIAMIFQEPMVALNPVYTIGNQITEAIRLHQQFKKKEARARAIEMLMAVGMADPEQRIKEYPHQLSGGMKQRAMIAMALCCRPLLLIADEPTTALDVTIQAQVLDLMRDLRKRFKTAIMFVTHDLGVIAQIADSVVVMYLGKIVESAPVREIFHNPLHPYMQGLISSMPSIKRYRTDRLIPIKGVVPDLFEIPLGCGFAPRCQRAMDICKRLSPTLKEESSKHLTACWLYQ